MIDCTINSNFNEIIHNSALSREEKVLKLTEEKLRLMYEVKELTNQAYEEAGIPVCYVGRGRGSGAGSESIKEGWE